jgi:hypothetical protein
MCRKMQRNAGGRGRREGWSGCAKNAVERGFCKFEVTVQGEQAAGGSGSGANVKRSEGRNGGGQRAGGRGVV